MRHLGFRKWGLDVKVSICHTPCEPPHLLSMFLSGQPHSCAKVVTNFLLLWDLNSSPISMDSNVAMNLYCLFHFSASVSKFLPKIYLLLSRIIEFHASKLKARSRITQNMWSQIPKIICCRIFCSPITFFDQRMEIIDTCPKWCYN